MAIKPTWRICLVVGAGILFLIPLPAGWVELHYSQGVYPAIQSIMTRFSNLFPFALIDVLAVGGIAGVAFSLTAVARAGRGRRWRTLAGMGMRALTAAAATAICFFCCWGLNYQREPLTARLDFDENRIAPEKALRFAEDALFQLGRLSETTAPTAAARPEAEIATSLMPAFANTLRSIGMDAAVVAGRPKYSLLDPYFVRAGVSGMTDPIFLETLTASNLLPFERPAVIAHEWAHLAGLARESEASFVGWLTCLQADPAAQYSAWLEVFLHALGSVDVAARKRLMVRLPERVRFDLLAMAERNKRDQVRLVGQIAWRTYDSYLKSNHVASGVTNYSEVLRLILGTRFEPGWHPVLKGNRF